MHCLIPRMSRLDFSRFISLPSTDSSDIQPKRKELTPTLLVWNVVKFFTPPMNMSNKRFNPREQHGEEPFTGRSSSRTSKLSLSCLSIITVCQNPTEMFLALGENPFYFVQYIQEHRNRKSPFFQPGCKWHYSNMVLIHKAKDILCIV